MNLFELKRDLKEEKVENLYLFYGPEHVVINSYIKRISTVSGKEIKILDSVSSIARLLKSNSIFQTGFVYIVRDDKDYSSSPKAWEILKNNKSDNIIVLVYNSLDKRTKFYDSHKDIAVEVEKLSNEVLSKYIKRDYNLSENNAYRLINRCDSDYGKIRLVGEKLLILAEVEKSTPERVFEKAIQDNLIPMSNSNILYDFLDSILENQNDKNIIWLFIKTLKEMNESSIKLIGMLYNNFKSLLLVQSCSSKSNISEKTGLDRWLVNKMENFTGNFDISTLVKSLEYIRNSEKGLKTGEIEENIALENCLLNIFYD